MEIISPADIKLVKFLGAGGYGEVSSKACNCCTHMLQFDHMSASRVQSHTDSAPYHRPMKRRHFIIWLMVGIGLQVYLGKWHGSEVAVKCLNPGLFFGGGDANNHAAVNELVKEADMLGRYCTKHLFHAS